MLAERLFVIIPRLRGIQTWFLRFISETGSDRREVFGGILQCAQRYMDHRDRTSFTEARSLIMFVFPSVFPSVTLTFQTLQKAIGQSFRPIKLQIFTSKVQGPTGYPFWRLVGWDPPKGLFCPLKTPQRTKKIADDCAKFCKTYSPWSNKIFGVKMFDQGHP